MRRAPAQQLPARVSWSALLAGLFVASGVWLLLVALGAGVGLAAFDPRDVEDWRRLGLGFGIWGGLAGTAAVFVGGWLTGRLSGSRSRVAGMLHGATLWGVVLVAGAWTAAVPVGGTAVTATAVEAVGEAAASAADAADAEQAREAPAVTDPGEQVQETAVTGVSWASFLLGVVTLVAAALGGAAGVPKDRGRTTREEPVPSPGAPLSTRHA